MPGAVLVPRAARSCSTRSSCTRGLRPAVSGRPRQITLCEPRDADPSQGRISILAPVGTALLGLGVGDSIDWPLPNGRTGTFRIAAVSRQPGAGEEPD